MLKHWGVVVKDDSVHVVPCNGQGIALHRCQLDCECLPRLDFATGRPKMVVIHHDGH